MSWEQDSCKELFPVDNYFWNLLKGGMMSMGRCLLSGSAVYLPTKAMFTGSRCGFETTVFFQSSHKFEPLSTKVGGIVN